MDRELMQECEGSVASNAFRRHELILFEYHPCPMCKTMASAAAADRDAAEKRDSLIDELDDQIADLEDEVYELRAQK